MEINPKPAMDLQNRSDVKGAIDQLVNTIERQTFLREGRYPSKKEVVDQVNKMVKARVNN